MRVWSAFEPSADIGLAEYSVRKIFNEEGRPFDFLAFPHMVACGGPMDSFDSLYIREIVMQWASRLGKTFVVLCGSLYMSELAPCNQMLAGPSEDIGLQQTERVRLMGGQIKELKSAGIEDTLKKRLRFGGNTIYAAWAKSPGTLSNVNILYGGASELDLFEHLSTSKHPDPEEMFRDRFKDNDNSRKVIFESIPTLSGTYLDHNENEKPRSRIQARRLAGSDCSFWVGCPMCGHRQVLSIGNVHPEGYKCEECGEYITDEHRKTFIRSGVWAPRGCEIDPDRASEAAENRLTLLEQASDLPEGDERLHELREALRWKGWRECDYIKGAPDNDGEVASYQLSSLYALSLTWRRIAEERSESRNFVNQWLGETYDLQEDEEYDIEGDARSLAEVINSDLPRGELPEWAEHIILTCDRQKGSFPWRITAWDADAERLHTVDRGIAMSFAEVEELLKRKWGIRRLSLALIDSGYMSHETYAWCLKMSDSYKLRVYPVKGDKASSVKLHYKLNNIEDEEGRSSTYSRIKRMHINTQSTQEWMNRTLRERTSLRVFKAADPSEHQDDCEELLNEVETVKQATSTWDRFRTSKTNSKSDTVSAPNDQRDNVRYAFCGAQYARELAKTREPEPKPKVAQESAPQGFIRRPRRSGFIRR